MITLSAYNTTEVAKAVTSPFFLLYLGFATPVYLSSRGTVTYLGDSWVQSLFDVLSVQYDDSGANVAAIRISRDYRDTILSEGFAEIDMGLYAVWGAAPSAGDDALELIRGYGDDVVLGREFIDIRIVERDTSGPVSPRSHYEHQNIQPAGQKITIGNTTITIDRAEFL